VSTTGAEVVSRVARKVLACPAHARQRGAEANDAELADLHHVEVGGERHALDPRKIE
jgi:hypothetical protein